MKEKYSHKINRGNGSVNDALADVADLLVNTAKNNNKDQEKNFKWLIISVTIAFLSLVISIIMFFK
jgi:hypothetical protein